MIERRPPRGTDALEMSRSEIRSRALTGVVYMTSSAFTGLVVGFASNLVVARLLTPKDFGIVAIGSTVALVGGLVVDGGLGAGMVRRPVPPTAAELRTLNGIQLAIALAVWLPILLVAPSFGLAGAVTALMAAALPIGVLATPGRIVLMREMRYDRQVVIDVGAALGCHVLTVASVVLGAGVWGLAAGSVARAVSMTVLTAIVTSVGLVRPSLRGWREFGELIRFGVKFQASWLAIVAREQGLNATVAVVAGVATLGQWSLANKVLQLPILAFTSLYTVGFPAMSNLLARGEDPGPIILRTVRRAAMAGAAVFPAFAASSIGLVPAVFGGRWQESAYVLPWISLSTLILSSISVGATSYLAASGRPGMVAYAATVFGVTWVSVTAALLPVVGVSAIGVGNLAGGVTEAFLLDRLIRRTAGVAPYTPMLRPVGVAVVAGSAGLAVYAAGADDVFSGLAAGALAVAVSVAGLRLVCPDDLKDLVRLAVNAARIALPGRANAPVAET